jgi:hypothetical protein
MMRSYFNRKLFVALACTLAFSCGEDDGSNSDENNGSSANNTATGPANEISGSVEGGSQPGDVSASSETSTPSQNYGAVANKVLTVFLASANGIISFTVNTETGEAPGSYAVGPDLDGPAYLTWTAPGAIFEGVSGTIQLDTCPNDANARVTGRLQNVGLTNAITMASDGTLTATFAVTIVQSDGSAVCTEKPSGNSENGSSGPSPGPQCSNDICDGPCCPFLPAFTTCVLDCQGTCTDPLMFMACISCMTACEKPMRDDPACGSAYTALEGCAQRNMCEPGLDDNTCIASNCCDEYRGMF